MKYSCLLIVGLILLISMPVHAQFVTIARKIKSKHTPQSDVATVMIDAGTSRIYRVVMDTLVSDPKFEITRRTDADHLVEFTKESSRVSIKVDSLAKGMSQITVTANHSDKTQQQATDAAVKVILKVCNMVGIKCTVENP